MSVLRKGLKNGAIGQHRLQSDFDILKKTTLVGEAQAISADDTVMTDAILRESMVDILFEIEARRDVHDIRPTNDRRVIRVKVWSKVKPNLNSSTTIAVMGRSQSEMARACEYAAAALAERQCGLYGDNHNLVEIAKAGRDHFNELCRELARKRAG